jgi:hypothetical protein
MSIGNYFTNFTRTVGKIGTALNPIANAASTVGQLGSLATQKNPVGQLGSLIAPAITAAAPEVGVPLTLGSLIAQHYANQSASGANATGQQSNADQATQEEQPQ